MKKVVLSVFALSLLSLASCKKDYVCKCTSTSGGYTASSTLTIHATKKDAKDACDAFDASASAGGVTSTTACEIE